MSETTELGQNWIAIHDGDYDGEVVLRQLGPRAKKPLKEITLPASVLLAFAAEAIRQRAAQRIDGATAEELLYGQHAALVARVDRLERPEDE